MKKSDEMSERELLIRIDERTQMLPDLKKKVDRHEVTIAVLSIFVVLVIAKTFPVLADVFAGR